MTDENPARIATVTDFESHSYPVMYLLIANATDASRPAEAKVLDRRDAAQHIGKEHVKDGAKDQRSKNADRHVALWISRFLRGGRDGVETDVSEKDDAGCAENSEDSAVGMRDALRRRVGRRRGNQRGVVGRIDEVPPDPDDEQHDASFSG